MFFKRADTKINKMFFSKPTYLARAEQIRQDPPKGTPQCVAIPGTEKPGRSKVYRLWSVEKELLETLDPKVCWNWLYDIHCRLLEESLLTALLL